MPEPVPPDLRDLLALHLVPGIGPRLTAALLERFGSAGAARRACAGELAGVPRIGEQTGAELARALREADVDGELARVERAGVRLVVRGSPEYPPALAEIPGAPFLLYLRGALTPADAEAVAVVGTRRCSEYGRRVAARLAAGLARAGVTVVSGLARGVDGVAHRSALGAGGRTVAVLAGGLERVYPPEHKGLAEEVSRAGALVTESAMGQEPLAGLFPARNRIISGLSKAVVVVEADERSGALITARHAAEQGRTVLAVPGPVDVATSAGCHALLRDGAVLCRGPEDVLEEVRGVSAVAAQTKEAPPAAPAPALGGLERGVWEALAGGARTVDELAQGLGVAVAQLSGALLMMEMNKVVRRLPGNRYERC
jgi:DNA processing protein